MTQAAQPQPAPSLPDINAQTYPFEVVQVLLDRAAYFNLLSVPSEGSSAISGPSAGVIGWRISENLHRFDAGIQAPTSAVGLKAANLVGEKVASLMKALRVIQSAGGASAVPVAWVVDPQDVNARAHVGGKNNDGVVRHEPADPLEEATTLANPADSAKANRGLGRNFGVEHPAIAAVRSKPANGSPVGGEFLLLPGKQKLGQPCACG